MTQTVVLARQGFSIGDTISDEVAITTGPTFLMASLDATGYVDGTALSIFLQYKQDPADDWEQGSATVNERGRNLDGSPSTAWWIAIPFDGPLPETTIARIIVRVDSGPGLETSATLSF